MPESNSLLATSSARDSLNSLHFVIHCNKFMLHLQLLQYIDGLRKSEQELANACKIHLKSVWFDLLLLNEGIDIPVFIPCSHQSLQPSPGNFREKEPGKF